MNEINSKCVGVVQQKPRGSCTRFSLVYPTKVKASKSFLFTEKFPCIENKEHLLDLLKLKSLSNTQSYLKYKHVYIYLNHANSFTKLTNKIMTGCLRMTKRGIF